MDDTFYFYDLETSGFNPRDARIMQFAGQRTDMKLKPIGNPDNFLIKITEDVLPEPDAILVTGITPQQTIADGITEAEFLKYFHEKISIPGTIFTGFNTVRFDDEFMRFLNYRNFYDPYEWQWQEKRSRWDILDVVRMTRALRPEGIKWPFDSKGKPSNKLELLTSVNNLSHDAAHDALSDVNATISVARTVLNKQPKIFNYLLSVRSKNAVRAVVEKNEPFVYTSGKFSSDYEKTTVVGKLVDHPNSKDASLIFDLRYDPSAFIDLSPEELAAALRRRTDEEGPRLPVKTIKFNRCPAIAPISVIDEQTSERLDLNLESIKNNFNSLNSMKTELSAKVLKALEMLDKQMQSKFITDNLDADAMLYDGFFNDADKTKMSLLRASPQEELKNLELVFSDSRLQALLPLYVARNYQEQLRDEDRAVWEQFKERKLLSGGVESKAVKFFNRIAELSNNPDITSKEIYILEELKLYGESILPVD
jgi:exodeoxyribonuclease-1